MGAIETSTQIRMPRYRRYFQGRAQARTRPDSTAPAVASRFAAPVLFRNTRRPTDHHSGSHGLPPAKLCSSAPRKAFTLTEMLVVMVIVGILMAISLSALFAALGTGRAAGTRALIEKLDRALNDRLASLETRKITVLPIDTLLAWDQDLDLMDPNQPQLGSDTSDEPLRALVIAKKRIIKEEFPQWFDVVKNPPVTGNVIDVVGDWDPIDIDGDGVADQLSSQLSPVAHAYRNWVRNIATRDGIDNDNNGAVDDAGEWIYSFSQYLANHDPKTTSSECLYMILTLGPGSTSVDPAEFPHGQVEDTDGDGLLEFIDGFGQPIRFYRWPTHFRSGTQQGDAPYQLGRRRDDDRNDPNRLLMLRFWWNDTANGGANRRLFFENVRSISPLQGTPGAFAFHSLTDSSALDMTSAQDVWSWELSLSPPAPNPNYGLQARAYSAQPLIVSAGIDEQFGLDVLPLTYLQARILQYYYVSDAALQNDVQMDASGFARSIGGFDEVLGAHLDNITNHDLKSDQ